MIHLQRTVTNWDQAIAGDFPFLVKTVDEGAQAQVAKRVNPNCKTSLRHFYDGKQVPSPLGTIEDNLYRARDFFNSFVDGTFIEKYAQYTDFIEEWNEYLANSQDMWEVDDFAAWAEAAAIIWRDEYRSRPELAHIRLILCNAAVGNLISRRFAEIAVKYDCVLGYHPYTLWQHNIRWEGDWLNLSGLFEVMEQDLFPDLKPQWAFTECGPFEAAETGWKASSCLGGDRNKYVEAVRQWITDVKTTAAFKEGRIIGINLFTTGKTEKWAKFWTEQPELNMLSEMIKQEWIVPEPEPEPAPEEETKLYTYGIDVSRWQGKMDWDKVAAWRGKNGETVEFAVIRCTVGDYYFDPEFERNWSEARRVGIKIAPYHVVAWHVGAESQFKWFKQHFGDRVADFPIVLDVEKVQELMPDTNTLLECCYLFEDEWCIPAIYTASWCWNSYVLREQCSWLDYDLFVASYMDLPTLPVPWLTWKLWQYTSSGKVPGIAGNVDLDWFNGTPAEFEAYCAAYRAKYAELIAGSQPEEPEPGEPEPMPDPIPAPDGPPTWYVTITGWEPAPSETTIEGCRKALRGTGPQPIVDWGAITEARPRPGRGLE